MPNYYARGDYYGGGMGNYAAGDPFLGGLIRKISGVAGSILPGPIGAAARGVHRLTGGGRRQQQRQPRRPMPILRMHQAPPATRVQEFPGGGRLETVGEFPGPEPAPKRRRINPMNPRALRRASTRIDRFTKQTKKALKHTNYRLVSKSARRGRGSPGVITKAEAARALRG